MKQRFHSVKIYSEVEGTDVVRLLLLHENVPKSEKCVELNQISITFKSKSKVKLITSLLFVP